MKSLKRAFVLTLAILALGACAKKDGNFGSKNAMGARAKNISANQAVLDAGLKMDFFSIRTVSTNPMQFSLDLMVNDYHTTATIQQFGSQISSGQTNISGYNVNMQAVCLNNDCNPLIISAVATNASGTPYGQVAYEFFRLNADATQDRYQVFAAGQTKDINSLAAFFAQPDAD